MFGFLKSSGPQVRRIAAAEAIARAARGELTVIDVREAKELPATGIATGALHIPLGQIRAKADPKAAGREPRLSPDRPVAIYCAMGSRSGAAGKQMLALGYTEVFNIGGIGDWLAAGGPVSRA